MEIISQKNSVRKRIICILAAACIAAGGLSIVLYLVKDRQGPEIILPDTVITYTEGQSTESLLAGVTAVDERDRDVSDQLIVENVYLSGDGTKANIVYAAMDHSYNVSKITRTVQYLRAAE